MTNRPDLPDRESVLADFLRQHSIDKTAVIAAAVPIYWVSCALTLLNIGYVKHSDRLAQDPTSGLLLNMAHRAYEQVEGALVALVTGCGPTAEVAARAAIELPVSILYILSRDRQNRLLAYFDNYLEEVEKQIKSWKTLAKNIPAPARDIHVLAIENRERANNVLRTLVGRMKTELRHGPLCEKWPPRVFDRFEQIGEEATYRTIYARLCSQSHGDAEETLRYFMGVSAGDQKLMERMGIETWEFTRLMVFIASSFFISAIGRYAETFSISYLAEHLELGREEIDREMKSIAWNVGAF